MTVTTRKPDIVIVDEKNKKAVIYELTVPFERNIPTQHKYISEKYAHFETDIKKHSLLVVAFKVGSRGGLTKENTKVLGDIQKQVMKKNIQKKNFVNNIKSLSVMSSYYIFTARKHMSW